jgi:DNA-binding MarR family transcriptional regulator
MSDLSTRRGSSSRTGHRSGTVTQGRRAADLAHILDRNPILDAYLLNYLANFYVGPLLKLVDARQGLTRPEWIVVFCLSQHEGLNAQQIGDVTGRPKSSISHAIKLLERKKLLRRIADPADGRRQVLQLTVAGRTAYDDLVGFFVEREREMLDCLTGAERRSLRKLMLKLVSHMDRWAQSY